MKTNKTYNLKLVDIYCLQSDILIVNVNENNDHIAQPTPQNIPSNRRGSHLDLYTKPTSQPEKRLGKGQPPPTKIKNKIATEGNPTAHSSTNDNVDATTQSNIIHNNNASDKNDTLNSTTPNQPRININIKLTMSTPDPPSGSGSSRRRV